MFPATVAPVKPIRLCLAVFATAFAFAMSTPAQSAAPVITGSFAWESVKRGELKYLLHLPAAAATNATQRWPLMLFLHGAGERGNDVQRVGIHGPLKHVRAGTNFPFIIVAPQCPANERWQSEPLLQLLDRIQAEHPVDTNRVYVTGLSMGGYGTWALGLTAPERFAAIAPICGGANRIDMLLGSRDRAEALKNLPIWAFHGAKDPVVPLDESERAVKALQSLGVKDIKLTVYPEAQHDSWSEAYANPEFYEWLLKQRRN
jgi:predicted peptidase